MIVAAIIGLLTVVLSYFVLKREPELKAGIYRLPGRWYWLKRIAFFFLFRLRSAKKHKENGVNDFGDGNFSSDSYDVKGYGRGDGYGLMERPQPLLDHVFAIDCAYFGATNKDGCNIVFRLARRQNRCAEIWLFLEVPEIGCLQYPHHPDTDVYFTDGKHFRAGGLAFEILEPMKRWKITYSGKLRKGLCNNISSKPQDFVETNFSFTWSAFSQPFNFDTDMACSLLGDSVAREKWDKDFFQRLKNNHQTHYEQWGELRGRLQIEGYDDSVLYLQCVRDHSFGRRDWRSFHRYIIHFIYLETGMTIQVGVVCQPNLMTYVKIGYVSYANGDIVSVSDVALNLWEVAEEVKDPPPFWTFSFQADGQTFVVKATKGTTPVWYHHEDRGGKVMEVFTDFEVNSIKGRGISEYFYRNSDGPTMTVPTMCPLVVDPSEVDLKNNLGDITLKFASFACRSPALVGGKGAQLAQLSSLQREVNAEVPPGFCLTLRSFELQLQKNRQIVDAIQAIAATALAATMSDLSNLTSACRIAVDVITTTDVCSEVKAAILDSLQSCFGTEFEKVLLAVRSSAAGEDGSEASSAGQMDTVLGVIGFSKVRSDHAVTGEVIGTHMKTSSQPHATLLCQLPLPVSLLILEAIRQCWSSAYTAQAVEYRRQHGQPINVLVGLVIQKLVPAHAAGVMFTADPISGSNSSIVINANYGLGESVVSGKSDPDTISVDRDPEFVHDSSALRVSRVRAGEKKIKIVESDAGGIVEESVSGDTTTVCLTNQMIIKLAALGIELEKRFGCPRDIEWAIVGENIFMLQCRPITVAENESEEDLIHEFDSPITCDYQWLTTSNISEMMPGAVTPLTLSTFASAIEYSMQMLTMHLGARHKATHLPKCLPSNCNHHFICLLLTISGCRDITTPYCFMDHSLSQRPCLTPDVSTIFMTTMMVRKDSMEVNLLGNLLPDFKTEQTEKYFGRPRMGFVKRVFNFISMMRMWSRASTMTAQWEKRIPGYRVGEYVSSARDLYKCIDDQLVDYETVWVWTLINSGRSGNIATALMSIIGGNASEWTSDHYGDIALLLSKCDGVYSAEVPHAMKNIAREIVETSSQLVDSFLSTPDVDCLALLRNYSNIEKMVNVFLDRHGHRCLREAELREKSWRSAPEKFISVLKIMLKTKSYVEIERKTVSVSEILSNLKTKIAFHKRLILKLLLPRAWKEVGAREWGKSVSVQMSEIFKLAYSRLAMLLHKETMLPDADLMYFLTHKEIGKLISSHSAHLIIKAQRRRKVLVKQMEKKFEKINISRPVPISAGIRNAESLNVDCLNGMPVSQGQVSGPAQVVHSLEDAWIIKPGDILVVNSTDVGWSPYFPLIGGLITELGGLISHGAVVAREYGIPCVVNVSNATSIIQSGEMIELNGGKGTVKRLREAKTSD